MTLRGIDLKGARSVPLVGERATVEGATVRLPAYSGVVLRGKF